MRTGIFAVVVLAASSLATGCDGPEKVSSAPEGITIFEDRNFRGKSLTLDRDQPDLSDIEGPCYQDEGGTGPTSSFSLVWNDCISSIRVSPGWTGTAYGDDDYEGSSLNVTEDVPDLRNVPGKCGEGMNDCISSIRVARQ